MTLPLRYRGGDLNGSGPWGSADRPVRAHRSAADRLVVDARQASSAMARIL
jgi:hypothetical protein